jgi:hypothetical protein
MRATVLASPTAAMACSRPRQPEGEELITAGRLNLPGNHDDGNLRHPSLGLSEKPDAVLPQNTEIKPSDCWVIIHDEYDEPLQGWRRVHRLSRRCKAETIHSQTA